MTMTNLQISPQEEPTRRAILVAQSIVISTVLFFALTLYLVFAIGGWQVYVSAILAFQAIIAGFVSIGFIRRGQVNLGGWVYFISVLIAGIGLALLIADVGFMAAGSTLIASYIIIKYVMLKETRRVALMVAAFGVIIVILTELVDPAWRLVSSLLLTIFPIVTGIMGVIIIAVLVRQTWVAGQVRLEYRLTLLVLLIAMPILALVTILMVNRAAEIIETQSTDQLQTTNRTVSNNISAWLKNNVQTLDTIVTMPDVISMNTKTQTPVLETFSAGSPHIYLVHTVDLKGFNVARSDGKELTDYHDRKYFTESISGASVTFQSLVGRTSGEPAVCIGSPIEDSSGALVGVGAICSDMTDVSEEVQVSTIGETGFTFIIDTNNRVVAHPNSAYTAELSDFSEYPPVVMLRDGTQGQVTFTDEEGHEWRAYLGVLENGWGVIAQQEEVELQESLAVFQRISWGTLAVGLIILVMVIWFIIRQSIRPFHDLTRTTEAVAAGDLSRTASEDREDEFGTLARAFNSMTSQLRETLENLEERVANATRNLTLAAEIGRNVSQAQDVDTLLKDAVDLIQDRFDMYYTQVYLLNPAGRQLVLHAGTGTVGQQLLNRRHSLQMDLASLNGTAAVERRTVIVEDTETSLIHRPNPLLPETRSEMVVPLLVGDRVVGVLDMQSRIAGALSQENLSAFEALAGQIAVALQNIELLNETEAARAKIEAQSRRLIRAGWDDFLNAVDRDERIGFTYDLENMTSYTEPVSSEPEENALVTAIPVSNEPVGVFKFEGQETWGADEVELVNTIARQVGQQVENLRLLAQADQYRAEAEEAIRHQISEGWEAQFATTPEAEIGFTYNLNAISPLSASDNDEESDLTLTTQVLEVMGEKIGELSISESDSTRQEINELLSTVGQQLATRVENLRLFEETERGQIELDKRARHLASVAEISTAASKEPDVQKMLESVVHLTQRQFNLYHAHVFIYNEAAEELEIVACGYKEGDEQEGTHGTAHIPIAQEQSLVARAARTGQAVIINDVRNEPGWLPNPELPDTGAELAVPLLVGDELLGVLDVQSESINAFTDEDANIQLTLASQVATAMQNARSFTQAQKQADREATLNIISQKIQSATSVEAVLQIAARELGQALDAPMTIAQLSMKDKE